MTIATTLPRPHQQVPPTILPSQATRPLARAIVVHPSDVVRAGVTALLTNASVCKVAGAAASLFDALRLATTAAPQVVLFGFTAQDGPETCRLLAGIWPRPRLIALVAAGQPVRASDCLAAGADAAVAIDDVPRETFLELVEAILDGRGPLAVGFPSSDPTLRRAPDNELTALLTPRERELLYLIGQGLSNREIAEMLVLSVKTIETHRANLARKLNIRSRAGLMRLALVGHMA